MNRLPIFLALLAAMLVVLTLGCTACDTDGKYVRKGDTIYYTYWTFSFGQRYDTLHEADAATFRSVNRWLGADRTHVFYLDRLVPGADPATLQADHKPLFHDKADYYYKETPMHVADMKTFKVLEWVYDDFYATDSRYAYFDAKRFKPDLATFRVKESFVAVDRQHVYRFGELLPGADPDTYQESWKGYYSRDKSHIWHNGTLLKDADYATFTVDSDNEAHDKHGRFFRDKRVEEEVNEELPPEAIVVEADDTVALP